MKKFSPAPYEFSTVTSWDNARNEDITGTYTRNISCRSFDELAILEYIKSYYVPIRRRGVSAVTNGKHPAFRNLPAA